MNTCLACSNSIPEGFGICLDCETLLQKAQLVVEVFATLQQRQARLPFLMSAPNTRVATQA